jgi:hypothetical protein
MLSSSENESFLAWFVHAENQDGTGICALYRRI